MICSERKRKYFFIVSAKFKLTPLELCEKFKKVLFFLQSDMNSSQHFLESLKLSSAFISCEGSPTAITSELALVIAVLKANGLVKLFNGLRGFPVSQHMSSTVHINSTEMFLHKNGNTRERWSM